MTDISQSYKKLGIPYFREVFELLDETFKARSIPYYLLGATAISLELLKDGIKPSRGTKDIDFAIMISSKSAYDEFADELQKKGFVKVAAPWTFRHPTYDIVVDVLPFGEIEENYTENFNHRHTDLHVLGLKEVMSTPVQVAIEEILVNIPTLHGMVILKLVAWSDRPEERENDLGDILLIISEYYWLMSESIIDQHTDLLELLEEDGRDRLSFPSRSIMLGIVGGIVGGILTSRLPLLILGKSFIHSSMKNSGMSVALTGAL